MTPNALGDMIIPWVLGKEALVRNKQNISSKLLVFFLLILAFVVLSQFFSVNSVEKKAADKKRQAFKKMMESKRVTDWYPIKQREKPITLEELKGEIERVIGGDDEVTHVSLKNGRYEIRYQVSELFGKKIDKGLVEDYAFLIMPVFIQNSITNFLFIYLIAIAQSPKKKGRLGKIIIAKRQLEAFAEDYTSLDKTGFLLFEFDESFY